MSISVSFTAHRSTGISPVTIFFDATATTSTATSDPFSEIYYQWDFGDTGTSGTGTWSTGVDTTQTKNVHEGPMAAHNYEVTEGGGDKTFTVTLKATDGTSSDTVTQNVTIYDPAGANGWTTTHVVCQDGNFTGAPAGTQHTHTAAQLATVYGYLGARVRVFLKSGETWNRVTNQHNQTGPWMLAGALSWGSGAKPKIAATANGDHLMVQGAAGGPWDDIRWVDLDFDGLTFTGCTFQAYDTGGSSVFFTNWLILRCTVQNVNLGSKIHLQDNVFFIENTWTSFTDYCSYNAGGDECAQLGNAFTYTQTGSGDNFNGHCMRLGDIWNKWVISNNTLRGSASSRHIFKCHAQGSPRTDSTKLLFSRNKIGGTASYGLVMTDVGPQSAGNDERCIDVIFEDNWFISDSLSQYMIIAAPYQRMTVRNNVVDGTICMNNNICRFVNPFGFNTPPWNPDGIYVYNNTLYSGATGAGSADHGLVFWFSVNGPGCTSCFLRNNYAYAPTVTPTNVLYVSGGVTPTNSNNTIRTTTPGWVSSTPTTYTDFKLIAGSAAIAAGTSVPIWKDAFSIFRIGVTNDQGFHQFTAGTDPFGGGGGVVIPPPTVVPRALYIMP